MLPQLLLNGIIAGSAYALIALGFGLIYSTGRFFHFAHGAVYTAGAYLAYLFYVKLDFSFPFSILLSILTTALLGCSIEILIYRPLRKKKAHSNVFLLSSIGLFIVLQNFLSLIFGDDTKSIRSGIVIEGFPVIGARITLIQIATIGVSIVLCLATWAVLRFTRIGRMIRAVANDAELSEIVGVNSKRVFLSVFAMGSGLAAIAAILISLDTDLTPTMGFNALLMGVIAVIIGGVGSIPGSFWGGLFVGLAQNVGVWKLPTQWQDSIVFLILILFLLLRPQGIFGRPLRKATV